MIDPNLVTTVKVGQLPSEPFLGSDLVPHEVNGNLKKGTITDFATFLATIIGSSDAVGFRPVTIVDGQTLPSVTPNKNEFILVGKGTFQNVGGGLPITTTAELNALVTSGVSWSIGVEIPIQVESDGTAIDTYKTDIIYTGATITVPSGVKIRNVYLNQVPCYASEWSQSGTTITVTTAQNGDKITLIN
jgi:hypothetical protein